MAATLRVSGRQRMLDRYRRWDVVLDGTVVGVVVNGQATDLPVEHGTPTKRVGPLAGQSPQGLLGRGRGHRSVRMPPPATPGDLASLGVASLYRHDLFIVPEPASG
jgi:hypothetical protein